MATENIDQDSIVNTLMCVEIMNRFIYYCGNRGDREISAVYVD